MRLLIGRPIRVCRPPLRLFNGGGLAFYGLGFAGKLFVESFDFRGSGLSTPSALPVRPVVALSISDSAVEAM